jgi:site-specific recombinase XerD
MTDRRTRPDGPLASHEASFAEELSRLGYKQGSARRHLKLLADLDCWLAGEGLAPGELTSGRVAEFLGSRRARGYQELVTPVGFRALSEHLVCLGAVPEPAPRVPAGSLAAPLGRFCEYLAKERGLSDGVIERYLRVARAFSCVVGDGERVDWGSVWPAEVTRFLVAECRRAPGARKALPSALRSFLRFALLEGWTTLPLAQAVPSVASWTVSSLPKRFQADQVRRLLASCDRQSAAGRRDYAVLTLLARLGLRAGEVAAVQLGDIDWRAGEVVVRGKGHRDEKLPLPSDIGEAISDYLVEGRPSTTERNVFLRALAPWRALTPPSVTLIVYRACDRAGIPRAGAHRIRHSAASEMLNNGASLTEVGQVLRHRSLLSTQVYAKVDHGRSRRARPPLARRCGMTDLSAALQDYLMVRRALGHKLEASERLLGQFLDYYSQSGATQLTVDLAVTWATLPKDASPVWWAQRLSAVRGFASWLQTLEHKTQVPPKDTLPARARRAAPYLYSDAEVGSIISAARALRPELCRETYTALVGLLWVTGARVGEAIRLDWDDVELGSGVVRVRQSKFGKSRELLLHPSSVTALLHYAAARDRLWPVPKTKAFFISLRGNRLVYETVWSTFSGLTRAAGLSPRSERCRPTVHALRHSFAVRTLLTGT